MCGRLNVHDLADAVMFLFGLSDVPSGAPRYNIAPTQPLGAVRVKNAQGEKELVMLHWGLIPGWAKDPSIGNRMFNARAETIAEKPSFRNALRRRRCLIPAHGFYEWQRRDETRQPYHIRRADGAPFAMAGIWEHWMAPDGSEISSCAIITTAANALMAGLHHRMPVILPAEEYPLWLDPAEGRPEKLLPLLASRDWEDLRAVPVSTYVNNSRNEGPQCVEPLSGNEDGAAD